MRYTQQYRNSRCSRTRHDASRRCAGVGPDTVLESGMAEESAQMNAAAESQNATHSKTSAWVPGSNRLKPQRGDLFIASEPTPPFPFCFSTAPFDSQLPTVNSQLLTGAPSKSKKENCLSVGFYKQAATLEFGRRKTNIGNRLSAASGGDQSAGNLRLQTYVANLLNQYTNRTVPRGLDMIGVALAPDSVTVNAQSPYSYTAAASDWLGRTAQDTVSVNLPTTPATPMHHANGNLSSDGTRAFEYPFE